MTNSGRSGKANSASKERRQLRTLEDMLALLVEVNQARVTIKQEAWQAGNQAIYQAAEAQRQALEKLKQRLSERWYELFGELDDNNNND